MRSEKIPITYQQRERDGFTTSKPGTNKGITTRHTVGVNNYFFFCPTGFGCGFLFGV
ncbi:MAG: hypothetical protein GNW80_06795 [Asgard group archaeon]|nr:hypothetical protein [Asgard group archaeon]